MARIDLMPADMVWIKTRVGLREAYVLGVLEGMALIEYQLRDGTSRLRVVQRLQEEDDCGTLKSHQYRSTRYTRLTRPWLIAVADVGLEWIGQPKRNLASIPQANKLLGRT